MEILLQQRFRYATIILLKNYCKMADFQLYKYSGGYERKKIMESLDISGAYSKKKNTLFFRNSKDTPNGSNSYAFPTFEVVKTHETMSDKQITRHYNNPFASVNIHIFERTIKQNGNKIIITNSDYCKHRRHNARFFSTAINRTTFTFDFSTGNFQIIQTTMKGNKKLKSQTFRTNNFFMLKNSLSESPGIFRLTRWKGDPKFKFIKEMNESINEKEYLTLISKIFQIDIFKLNKADSYIGFYDKILEKFIELRKIKVPNHSYEHFITYHYPKEKLLKKNNRKLIAAVLDMYQIKSKFTVKLIHKYPYLNLAVLSKLCMLLGDDYIKYLSSIDDNIFSISQTQERASHYSLNDYSARIANFKITDVEKENMIKILNDSKVKKPLTEEMIGDLYDHFNMIDKIRFYDDKISLKAKTYIEFNEEHNQYAKLIATIKKGWVIEYVYDNITISQIEQPIPNETDDKILYPYILKREEEYNEEGKFMHHCVASYSDKDNSIIISIRNERGTDRVTCEFDIQTGNMIQARYFCNAVPPESFKDAIETVGDKIRLLARFGTLNWKEKKKVRVKINNIEVISSEPRRFEDLF